MLKEWSLVAFTILGQAAVGLGLLFFIPWALGSDLRSNATDRDTATLVAVLVLGLSGLAALLSFFHLRHPFRARRVLMNLGTSWLSREILAELLFSVSAAWICVLLLQMGPGGETAFRAVLITASAAGILFLISMSKVYMLPTLPPWSSGRTLLSFAGTALTLGALLLVLLIRISGRPGDYSSVLLVFSAAVVIFKILRGSFSLRVRAARSGQDGPSLRPPAAPSPLLRRLRTALLILSLPFIGMNYMAVSSGKAGAGPALTIALAFVLVLAEEAAGRFLFYGLVPRPGD